MKKHKKCGGVFEPHRDKDGDQCLKCSKWGALRYDQLLSNVF